MLTTRLKLIVGLSIPLFLIHAVEEYSTGLLRVDPLFRWVTAYNLPTAPLYFAEQIVLVVILLWAIYWPQRWLLALIGLLFVFEIAHVIQAIASVSYYPGLMTALVLIILGFFFWKEFVRALTRE